MPNLKDITNLWKNIGELDLRPIRDSALQTLRLAIAGAPGSGRHTLSEQLHVDPTHPDIHSQTPLIISDLENTSWVNGVDLVILMLDAPRGDFNPERQFARRMMEAGKKVLLFANKIDQLPDGHVLENWADWQATRIIYGSATDQSFLIKQFVPAVLELIPDQQLALGRQLPFFRIPIAHRLINDTCVSNAAYALSTGLAEVVPVLDLPLNVTDMVVLSKAQAFLVYKLGLNFGFSTRWQDYFTEFGSVIGSGFMWRQMARMLVGLIPVWGIVPKVTVAYAGTYVVGTVVLQWYQTGRQVSAKQMREIYAQALKSGQAFAKTTLANLPRPRLFRRKPKQLPAQIQAQSCAECGRANAKDAVYCQYCGKPLSSGL